MHIYIFLKNFRLMGRCSHSGESSPSQRRERVRREEKETVERRSRCAKRKKSRETLFLC